jgi:hypothetical protein
LKLKTQLFGKSARRKRAEQEKEGKKIIPFE